MNKILSFKKFRGARMALLALSATLLFTAAQPVAAQEGDKQCDEHCLTSRINVNTGYDFSNGNEYPGNTRDGYWRVTMVPTGGATESVPYCAHVLDPYPGWSEFPSPDDKLSQWISALPQSGNGFNNWFAGSGCTGAPSGNPYRFARRFHICGNDPVPVKIDLTMLADDLIDNVMIDNASIATFDLCTNPTPNHIWSHRGFVNATVLLAPGDHDLVVDLRNVYGVAMGVNIQGTISCERDMLVSNRCESPTNCEAKKPCFEKTDMKIDFRGYDERGNCIYTVEAFGFGANIIGYEWNLPGQAPFVVHTSASSDAQTFTIPNGISGNVSVIIHAVNKEFEAGQDPCCAVALERTVYCGEKGIETAAAKTTPEEGVKVFPNPASNSITVIADNTGISQITISSLTGKIIRNIRVDNQSRTQVSLEGIAPGTYHVTINGKITKVITKL